MKSIILVLSSVLLLSSCSWFHRTKMISIGIANLPETLDPVQYSINPEASIVRLLHRALFTFAMDPKTGEYRIESAVAELPVIQGKKISIKVKDGAKFNFLSGDQKIVRDIDSEDIAATILRVADPDSHSVVNQDLDGIVGLQEWKKLSPENRRTKYPTGISFPDKKTVQVELRNPNPFWHQNLVKTQFLILPKEAYQNKEFTSWQKGTGEFHILTQDAISLTIVKDGQNLKLLFMGKLSNSQQLFDADKISVLFVPDGVRLGDFKFSVFTKELERQKGVLLVGPALNLGYLRLSSQWMKKNPDGKLRVSQGLRRDEIVSALLPMTGKPMLEIVPGITAPSAAEKTVTNGKPLNLRLGLPDISESRSFADAITGQLSRHGITVQTQFLQPEIMEKEFSLGRFDLISQYWVMDAPDWTGFMNFLADGSTGVTTKWNQAVSKGSLPEALQSMNSSLQTNSGWIPLVSSGRMVIHKKNIQGLRFDGLFVDFSQARIE
ncbi:ABC transporter substrate-binding protein [Bdellovibrio sp. GT3]|uniref:ABC transporter substrate-binding protein n=1 Tax=Bdellovibrio sp. GT3 TaxID=3136282 RepID=UPI0030F01D56